MRSNRPSATAQLTAASLVLLSREPQMSSLISPAAAQASRWFLGDDRGRYWHLCGQHGFRALVAAVESRTLPGILRHFALRKRFLEDIVRDSLAEDFRQIVVLGAGFDTLALRLCAEWPNAAFLEADHPATQSVKQDALAARALLPDNLILISADFSDPDWPRALLSSPHYDPAAETVFVAEGLLMYLPPASVAAVFDFARAHSSARCRFAFTFLEPQANGAVNFAHSSRLVDFWLRLRGERFAWGVRRDELPQFLGRHGFRERETIEADALQRRYLPPDEWRGHVSGDLIGVAERLD